MTDAQGAFDELRRVHRAFGGTGPGRRRGTEQLNHSFVLLLSARFQAYGRDLHSATATAIESGVAGTLSGVIGASLTRGRKLDVGNPNPGNIGSDFNRFGFNFWTVVKAADRRNPGRQLKLENLNAWRNAISHHDIASKQGQLQPAHIKLSVCRNWQSALNGLVESIDDVVAVQVQALVGTRPW